jgi:hypothetical protein
MQTNADISAVSGLESEAFARSLVRFHFLANFGAILLESPGISE